MNSHKKLTIPLIFLLVSLLLSGCAIGRRDRSGTIGPVAPSAPSGETPTEEAPGEATVPDAGETPPVAPLPDEISTDIFEAPEAPEATPIEGKVLVKLSQQASIQARGAELGAQGTVETDLPTLDDLLGQIGAKGLEPVIQEVVDATPRTDDTLESFSAQSEDAVQLFSVSFDAAAGPPEDVAELLETDPTVEFAEPDYLAGITADPVVGPSPLTPNDPYFQFQWNMNTIQAPAAWDRTRGQGVIVAVIDTGIDFGAPDLGNTQRLPGYDFINDDPDATDDQGHGTHVAGTIAQSTNNGLGVTGVAYEATLLPIKVLGAGGQGSYEAIIQGIYYAVEQGAQVINMSLAGRAGSQALQEAVEYAHNRGVVVVAAAGNSNGSVEFPAAYDDFVIAVGATRVDNARAPYSNFGVQIDLVAPGGDTGIDQNGDTYGDGILQQTFKTPGSPYTYLFFEGTSMASPHIAGVAALMLSLQPNLSPMDVKSIMMQTAAPLGPPDQYGAGLVQAQAALDAIPGVTPPPPTEEPPTEEPPTEEPPTAEPPTVTPEPPTVTPVPPTITPIPPTITPVPTVVPLAGENLLTNGDFESEGGWVFGDTPVRGSYDSSIVLSGGRAARLGIISDVDQRSFSSIWQQVTIPAQASQVTLSANIYPISQDASGDIQYIAILNSRFKVVRQLSVGLSNSQTWETPVFDLSEFRGQTIFVYFSVFNRGGTNRTSAMYVDDVSLVWN